MGEVPVLSPDERATLITSLEKAEARVKSGQFVDYDPETFKTRLLEIFRKAKRTKRV